MIQPATGEAPKIISQADAPLDRHVVTPGTEPAPPAASERKTFEQVKAEMLAKFTGNDDIDDIGLKAETEKKPDQDPTTTTTEVDGVTDEELAAFVNRSKESRAQRAKLRALEAETPKVELATQIAAAVASGDHYKAARLAGIDMTKATLQAMSDGDEKTDEKTDELAAIKKEFAEFKAAQENEKKAAAEAAATERGRAEIVAAVTKDEKKYPGLSKDAGAIRTALAEAEELFGQITAEKKRPLTREEANRLINACLDEAEARKATKKPSSHSQTPSQPSQRPQQVRKPSPNPSSPTKPLSFEDARALIRRK